MGIGRTQRHKAAVLVICLLGMAVFFLGTSACAAPVKNLIVLIMDGCGDEQLTLARWYKGAPLALDGMRTGAVQTYTSDAVIADSAPAATAYATGLRTAGTMIGLTPPVEAIPGLPPSAPELALKPQASVLEGARLLGKATGIVVTCRIGHATPAAYFAHVRARSQEDDIIEQGVYQNIDVVLGGGRRSLLPAKTGGARQDQEDLSAVLRSRHYQLIEHREELTKVRQPKVYGLFAMSHLAPEIDRPDLAPEQPSLAEMTQKAIELMSGNKNGFFLLVEGSQIDWACHANDPAHLLSDLLMFDQAVQIALDFAKKDGQTLVLALPDHNTGGLTIGNRRTNDSYHKLTPELLLAPLKKMRRSAAALWQSLAEERSPEALQQAVRRDWGLNLSRDQAMQILELAKQYGKEGHYALGEVICAHHTHLGWTTHGHTGGDVPLFAYGPSRPVGLLTAQDIGRLSARALGFDLETLTRRLFVDASQAFPSEALHLDRSDPANPILRIQQQGREAALPINKNLLILNKQELPLEGIVVHVADTGKTYMPLEAVHLIKGENRPLPAISK
ncbi:MAG: alkaline phosphatase [Desulfobacca sp.]|uniref:alkaline phosphatase n=1 Tax=Desulfobacca sp. TaxID=2067990 RepID=UPI00404B423F